jgi:phosphatidylinositol 4-kinase A
MQYNPIFEFHSDRTGITLQLTDNYHVRNEILAQLQRNSNNWFDLALGRAPVELQSTLQVSILYTWKILNQCLLSQKYLAVNQSSSAADSAELGASVAEQFGKAIGPVQRQLSTASFAFSAAWH